MKNTIGVMQSDALCRDGSKFTLGALFGCVYDNWQYGVPMLAGHDAHAPIGWSAPIGLHLEPGHARVVSASSLITDDDDWDEFIAAYNRHLHNKTHERVGEYADELRSRLVEHLSGDEVLYDLAAAAYVGDGLATRVFPDLFAKRNKYGLVPLNELNSVQPGVFERDGLLLFAHPFFRRNLSRLNTLNVDLLLELERLADEEDVEIGICLDPDAIGLADTAIRPVEMEWWRGPHFDDDLCSIPPGVTQHKSSEVQRRFHGIDMTEFWWKSQRNTDKGNKEHVLEVEELLDRETAGDTDDAYACRYVHSIVDERTNQIEHLDGAIRGYSAEQYLERLDVDISKAGKRTNKTKLWQVDGDIPLVAWKTLIYHHYRNNPLVGEYLGDEHDENESADADPAAEPSDPLRKYVPHAMQAGDGLRLMLSFHRSEFDVDESEALVVPVETIGRGDESWWVVDAELLELEKALRKNGANLRYVREPRRISVKDMYHEFPVLLHSTREALERTLNAFERLLDAWCKAGDDRVVVARFGLNAGDGEVRVSVMGHVKDIHEWCSSSLAYPPSIDHQGLIDWLASVYEQLNVEEPSNDEPQLFDTVEGCGLVLKRVPVEECEPRFDDEHDALMYHWRIPRGGTLEELAVNQRVFPTLGMFIEEAICTNCADDYEVCSCSSVLDDGVAERIEKSDLVGFFYSDKSAIAPLQQR